jgi:phage/plasmid-like protein (TIGR03299 family)
MAHHFQSGLFFGQKAWHGLGITLDADSPVRYNIDDAIRIAGLDWNVESVPLHIAAGAEYSVVNGHKAIVRGDSRQVLGVVGANYNPLQNRDQFNWFKPFLDTQECQLETCGALKGGSIVWVLAKINRSDAEVGNGDMVKKYLLLTSSHDGSKATVAGFCPIRTVCWNTLSAGLVDANSTLLKVRHTAKQHKALETIRETINLVDQTFEATAAQYRKLAACNVDTDDLRKYVKLVLEAPEDDSEISSQTDKILDRIVALCTSGEGNDGKTAWSAYNGVTHYVTHERGRSADTRLRANWYGEGKKLTDRAFKLALALAS